MSCSSAFLPRVGSTDRLTCDGDHTVSRARFRPRRSPPVVVEQPGVRHQLTPGVLRLCALVALFVCWGSYLEARRADLGARTAGVVTVAFCLVMIAAHVAGSRAAARDDPPAEGDPAALLGAVPLVPGLVLLLWHHAGRGASVVFLYSFSNDVVANALLIGAGVYAAAYVLARQPRWLLAAALALVLGIELHLSAGFQVTLASRGGGDWTRFLVTLGAVALLAAVGRLLRGEEERNLLVAAALLMPLGYSAIPVATGQDGVRAVVGAALLVALAVAVRRQLTVGIGFGLLILGGLEIRALGPYGSSLPPPALAGAAGLALAWLSVLAARHRHLR